MYSQFKIKYALLTNYLHLFVICSSTTTRNSLIVLLKN